MKEFTLLGTTLRYSTQRLNYYSIHSVFLKLAKESWKQFYTDYQKMGNLSKAYEQLPTVIAAVFRRIDSACEDHIKRQDIYSVKANDIRNHCQSALHEIRQVYQERIVAPYQAIDERKKAEAAQREFKKKVKANDLWDNLGYSALNAVGNLGSSLNASLDANSVYKNSDTLDRFKNAILDYTILAEHTTMRLIEENSNIAYDEPNSSEVSKLQNITDNILNGTVPSEKQDEMILDVLQGNPHAFELYDLLVKKYGDADGTLEDMATCFGYSDFVTYKLNLLKEKFSKELSATYTEEQDILDLKKQIEASAFMLPQGNAVHKTQATSLPANWIFGKAIWQRRKRPTLRSLYRPLWMVTPRSANCCWKFWALCSAIIVPKQSLCFVAPATAAKVCWRISCVGFWVSLPLRKSRICETSRCVGRLAISKGKSYWSAQNARTSPSAWMPVPSSRPSRGNLF